ncbi:MAG: hypothetical protein A4E54_02773 [Pelotomaculum sp. PtaB.Bin117]|nr:MAG: hypothetical protein A4E54_02773 [Pelotomaculum sp. PtaB.Bin117]OPY59172.1 MAG: hypothetical protein A4E56_03294 [Pelotomaculum sp. PtaU1.Bin065]
MININNVSKNIVNWHFKLMRHNQILILLWKPVKALTLKTFLQTSFLGKEVQARRLPGPLAGGDKASLGRFWGSAGSAQPLCRGSFAYRARCFPTCSAVTRG